MNDDILFHVATFFNTINFHYFQVNKRLYHLKSRYYNWYNYCHYGGLDVNSEYYILLKHFGHKLCNDVMNYRRSILKFLIDKSKTKIFLYCNNDYYRKLIHQFCGTQNLFHETKRPKEIRKIKYVAVVNILIL